MVRQDSRRASGGVVVLVHKSLESRVRKSSEGLVWVELSGVGRKMIVGVMYVNPEGVRETERLFEVLQVHEVKYEEKGFDVIVMEDFNARIGLGNIQIVMGRGCWSW